MTRLLLLDGYLDMSPKFDHVMACNILLPLISSFFSGRPPAIIDIRQTPATQSRTPPPAARRPVNHIIEAAVPPPGLTSELVLVLQAPSPAAATATAAPPLIAAAEVPAGDVRASSPCWA